MDTFVGRLRAQRDQEEEWSNSTPGAHKEWNHTGEQIDGFGTSQASRYE